MKSTNYMVCLLMLLPFAIPLAQSQGLSIGNSAYVRVSGSPKLIVIDGSFKNDGSYIKGTEKVIMGGTTACLMHGSATLTDMYDLEVSNTGGITTRLKQMNTHNTDITASSKLTIDTSSYVYVSDLLTNSATASGLHIKSSSVAPNGSLAFMNPLENPVQATVEMYSLARWTEVNKFPTDVKWQFFGIPIKSSTFSMPLFTGAIVRKHNEAGSNTTSNLWVQLSSGANIQNILGYELAQLNPKTYTFSGELFNQDISKTLAYTPKTSGAQYPGQHALANPFTAAIDIRQIEFGADTDTTIYQYNTGAYAEWLAGAAGKSGSSPGHYNVSTKYTAGAEGIDRYISSMQGFVVRAKSSSANATITIPYSAVVSRNVNKQKVKQEIEALRYMIIDVLGNRFSDRMWMFYNPKLSRAKDAGWDAVKLSGIVQAPQISAKESAGSFQINALDDFNNTVISFRAGEDAQYKMTFKYINMENIYEQLYLLDTKTGTLIDITQSGTEYTFSASNTSTEQRFKILTSAGMTTENNEANSSLSAINIENKLIINNSTSNKGEITVCDLNGIEVFKQPYAANQKSVFDLLLQQGVYIYKLKNDNEKIVSGKMVVN